MAFFIVGIIWLIGVVLALLGERRLREYKDYEHPKAYLIGGILLCIFTSWLMVFGALMNGTFEFPKRKKKNEKRRA